MKTKFKFRHLVYLDQYDWRLVRRARWTGYLAAVAMFVYAFFTKDNSLPIFIGANLGGAIFGGIIFGACIYCYIVSITELCHKEQNSDMRFIIARRIFWTASIAIWSILISWLYPVSLLHYGLYLRGAIMFILGSVFIPLVKYTLASHWWYMGTRPIFIGLNNLRRLLDKIAGNIILVFVACILGITYLLTLAIRIITKHRSLSRTTYSSVGYFFKALWVSKLDGVIKILGRLYPQNKHKYNL